MVQKVVKEKIEYLRADLVILSGFMRIISEPLLGSVPIINVHPADLRILDKRGKPKYTGDDAVTDAINAGETETCSTIHLVTKEIDGGPIITVSDPLRVIPGIDPKVHQEEMKTACDGPAYAEAMRMICDGEV